MSIGMVTPHAAASPETQWPLMTAGRIRTSVSRILAPAATATGPKTRPPVFTSVTDGVESAIAQAKKVAGAKPAATSHVSL